MQFSTSYHLPRPTALSVFPYLHDFPGALRPLRNTRFASIPFRARLRHPRRRCLHHGRFPPLRVAVFGGADVEESFRGGDPREEDHEGAMGEGSFVEVGYISGVHGLRGEVRVKPSTGFPELRFGEPGRRWLRMQISGKEELREVELMEGRSHGGRKGWILSFNGFDTVEKAKQIVGSSMLVKEGDRPKLEEGEFYTPDLLDMKVLLKETGRRIGTVVNVVNYGSSDLLQVMLDSADANFDDKGPSESSIVSSGSLVWVPFVEAIVPSVDMENKVMFITPPKGLLELNVRSDTRSKKERRQMEWMQRKKLQQHLVSAKKKLAEIGQEHVLRGFSYGFKNKKKSLAEQIVDLDLRLFQHAMGNNRKCFERISYVELLDSKSIGLMESRLQISHSCYKASSSNEMKEDYSVLQSKGLQLLSESKLAIVLVLGCHDISESGISSSNEATLPVLQLKNMLSDYSRFIEVSKHVAPQLLIILCPGHEIQHFQELLSNYSYFGFGREKVWLLEQGTLPVVNITPDDQNRHKILLQSPWEIIHSPVGPGGIFHALSSHDIVHRLNEMHVEFVQVCSLGQGCVLAHPLFLGLVSSRGVSLGLKIFEDRCQNDEVDMIVTMKHLSKMVNQVSYLQFYAVPELNTHVELVGSDWVNVEPSEPNSYRLHCPFSSLLKSCSPDDISVLTIVSD